MCLAVLQSVLGVISMFSVCVGCIEAYLTYLECGVEVFEYWRVF